VGVDDGAAATVLVPATGTTVIVVATGSEASAVDVVIITAFPTATEEVDAGAGLGAEALDGATEVTGAGATLGAGEEATGAGEGGGALPPPT